MKYLIDADFAKIERGVLARLLLDAEKAGVDLDDLDAVIAFASRWELAGK